MWCNAVGGSGWLIFFFILDFILNITCCCRTYLRLAFVLESRHEQPLEMELFGAALWIEEFQCHWSQLNKFQLE